MDLKRESEATLRMYGARPGEASFANNCLLARRMVERGVRFVQLYHADWDHHSDVAGGLKAKCGEVDQPMAALVKDLKQRGMLDDTLVVWGGEFGRTPMVESNAALGRSLGRDHHPQAFTVWMAGGGVRRGQTVGATDDLGFHITEDPVHVHDLQATILHLLGIDHEKLVYNFQGRDFRLTDVSGHVVRKILA
jgi:arylsulfatase A-like enzyme